MKKTAFGIILLFAGIAGIGFSLYIKEQVVQGKEQVSSAQGKVDQGNSLFNLAPAGKEVGGIFSKPFQNKIDEGSAEIQKYEQIASWLMIGGVIFLGLGLVTIFVSKKK